METAPTLDEADIVFSDTAAKKVAEAVNSNSPAVVEAIKQAFASKAAGVTGLIKRTKGATINPNLELLFCFSLDSIVQGFVCWSSHYFFFIRKFLCNELSLILTVGCE